MLDILSKEEMQEKNQCEIDKFKWGFGHAI